ALLAWCRGARRPAALALETFAANDWELLRGDPDFLISASCVAELAAGLGDATRAAELLRLLEPYGERFPVYGYVVGARGALWRYLALLARAAGRLDEAVAWGESAVAADEGVAVAEAVRARLALAATLLARGRAGDEGYGRAVLAAGRAEAERLGIGPLRALADAIAAGAR